MTTSQQVFRRRLWRLILVPVTVSLLIAAVLELQVHRLTSAQGWVEHTDIVLARARLLLGLIIDQETGVRGYVLGHDQRFLQPYQTAEASLPGLFGELRALVGDNSAQQQRLDKIQQSYEQWHAYAGEAIARTRKDDSTAATGAFSLAGKQMMDEVRRRQQDFVDAEEGLRTVRAQQSVSQGRTLGWTLLGLIAVFAVTLLNETRSSLGEANREYGTTLDDLQKRTLELSESRERLEVTLRSIGDGVIVTDHEGKITFLNAVAEKLTQHTQAQAAGKPLDEVFRIINEESRLPAESPFSKVMRLGTIVGLANHTLLLRNDGTEIAVDDSGAPIRDPQGQIFGVVLVFRDVTEQKEIMATLRSNEKLAAAGKLSASIAHEIHNPLETVRNVLFLIRKKTGTEIDTLIGMAEQELTRVVQITKNMLSLYRESKKVTAVKLAEVVDSVAVLMQRAMRDKNVTLSKDFLTEAQISAFPAEMRQVVSNLFSNAIDAVNPGGRIETIIEDTRMKDSRAAVALTVRDNGYGIAKEDQAKLFRPFFTTKGEQGTGLGLWITHGIVSKHGGYIEVTSDTSAEKHGTTFRVVFPRLGTEAQA